jgi:hypothetical protein
MIIGSGVITVIVYFTIIISGYNEMCRRKKTR